ncbi:hypothetical protein D5086_015144, partial [Populus alba]
IGSQTRAAGRNISLYMPERREGKEKEEDDLGLLHLSSKLDNQYNHCSFCEVGIAGETPPPPVKPSQ